MNGRELSHGVWRVAPGCKSLCVLENLGGPEEKVKDKNQD